MNKLNFYLLVIVIKNWNLKRHVLCVMQGLNLVLRLAWLQTVVHSNIGHVDYRVTGLLLASLEVIRRGQWNFYR